MAFSRTQSREVAFKMIFSLGFDNDVKIPLPSGTPFVEGGILQVACEDGEQPKGPEYDFVMKLYGAVRENLVSIDDSITKNTTGFTIDRIFKTDLAAIRMAIAEVRFMDAPAPVAANAAINIAKKYGTEKSGAFVNGALDKILNTEGKK